MSRVVVIDLEMNQPEERSRSASGESESGPIIQIGALIGCLRSGEVVATFDRIVDPNETITPFIEQLTGVTNERVKAEGVPLKTAYNELVKFVVEHKAFRTPVQWGVGDAEELCRNLSKYCPGLIAARGFIFGRRWIDVKGLYQSYCLVNGRHKTRTGLKKAAASLGIAFEGRAHDALVDCQNTFKLYLRLTKIMKDNSYAGGMAARTPATER